MAGTVTHSYFANDVMNKVSKAKKVKYDNDLLNVFAQSMDPFNFYSILFPIKKESSSKRKFASIFHHNKTDDFFYELITIIKQKKLFNDIQVMTFLYGLITHYVLDSAFHPYVEYKCGRLKVKDKNTYKYNAKHHEMETFIDIYMLRKHDINERKYKPHKVLFNIDKFSSELVDIINTTFYRVFQFDDFAKYYLKSITDMRKTFRYLRYDPYGFKKVVYKGFDFLSPRKVLNGKFLSYSYVPKNANDYLNLNHNYWNYPYDYSKKYNYSFDELYQKAVDNCAKLIIKVIDYLEKEKAFDIHACFSLSYSSGLNWRIPEVNPKYEF